MYLEIVIFALRFAALAVSPVYRQNPLLGNLYGLEPYPAPLRLEDVPILVRRADHDGVARGGLGRPERGLVHKALDLDGASDAVDVVVLGLAGKRLG